MEPFRAGLPLSVLQTAQETGRREESVITLQSRQKVFVDLPMSAGALSKSFLLDKVFDEAAEQVQGLWASRSFHSSMLLIWRQPAPACTLPLAWSLWCFEL